MKDTAVLTQRNMVGRDTLDRGQTRQVLYLVGFGDSRVDRGTELRGKIRCEKSEAGWSGRDLGHAGAVVLKTLCTKRSVASAVAAFFLKHMRIN